MRVVEYLLKILRDNGCTDIFGVPGGVVLDFLYAAQRDENITPYLSYHEQAAAFEAIGYAQVEHTLGVAYATRGPGFTNLITGIADAYSDSIPVLFITGHSGMSVGHGRRFESNQELDTVSMVKHITKYADVVESASEYWKIEYAVKTALNDRKGPVLLDFSSNIWNEEIIIQCDIVHKETHQEVDAFYDIEKQIQDAKRPLILIGDGIWQSATHKELHTFINYAKIPVISSRGSQDLAGGQDLYFGYIGSHGIRYANIIFDKSDLVISLGNSLKFPANSKTFEQSLKNKTIIQFEIDESEIKNEIQGLRGVRCDLSSALVKLNSLVYNDYSEWTEVCYKIRNTLDMTDVNFVVEKICEEFRNIEPHVIIVSDVGNNEFWTSRAYEKEDLSNRILYSKSFGALGCGIPKAIGASIKTRTPVLAIVGDQGLQFNVQELQFIMQHKLPIKVCVIDNKSSGMILDREKKKYGFELHTTRETGYYSLDIKKVADFYGIAINKNCLPSIQAIEIEENYTLEPSIPIGKAMYDMRPVLETGMLDELMRL